MSIEMTVESLERGIEALARLKDEQEVGKWILMSPSGDVWTGPPRKIIAALVGRVGIDELLGTAIPADDKASGCLRFPHDDMGTPT